VQSVDVPSPAAYVSRPKLRAAFEMANSAAWRSRNEPQCNDFP
jgi:hypothetical protein